MKIIATIFLLLAANATWAQHTSGWLSNKAFDFYLDKKNFDSALFYYQQIDRLFPDERSTYINSQIALCYSKLGDTSNAEKYYLRCLSFDKKLDETGSFQKWACFALSDIYYARQQFRQALTYLEYTKTKFKPLRAMCQGGMGHANSLSFAYKKSLCYYALGQPDSIVSELAPWIFRPVEDIRLDPAEYEAMSRFFVNAVFDVYGKAGARKALQAAIDKLIYKTSYDDKQPPLMFIIDCYLVFSNAQVPLNRIGGCGVKKKGDVPEYLTKESLLKELFDSPAYQYIMMDDLITILNK